MLKYVPPEQKSGPQQVDLWCTRLNRRLYTYKAVSGAQCRFI